MAGLRSLDGPRCWELGCLAALRLGLPNLQDSHPRSALEEHSKETHLSMQGASVSLAGARTWLQSKGLGDKQKFDPPSEALLLFSFLLYLSLSVLFCFLFVCLFVRSFVRLLVLFACLSVLFLFLHPSPTPLFTFFLFLFGQG